MIRGDDISPSKEHTTRANYVGPLKDHIVQGDDVGPAPPNPPSHHHLGPQLEVATPPQHSERVRVESAYIKSLRDGTGITDGQSTNLPGGM